MAADRHRLISHTSFHYTMLLKDTLTAWVPPTPLAPIGDRIAVFGLSLFARDLLFVIYLGVTGKQQADNATWVLDCIMWLYIPAWAVAYTAYKLHEGLIQQPPRLSRALRRLYSAALVVFLAKELLTVFWVLDGSSVAGWWRVPGLALFLGVTYLGVRAFVELEPHLDQHGHESIA
jgi:hypothetical protein